jgi:twitching motility protein PilT
MTYRPEETTQTFDHPAVNLSVDVLLKYLIDNGGSDLVLSNNYPPKIRIHGKWEDMPNGPIMDGRYLRHLVTDLLSPELQELYAKQKDYNFAYSYSKDFRFRVQLTTERGNPAFTMRVIPRHIKTVEELGLEPHLLQLTRLEKGLVLFTGPTGSGKSSAIASLIEHINANQKKRIVTLEDPIEFWYEQKRAAVIQREKHSDFIDYPSAMRYALQQAPDIIVVGEMHDAASMKAAIEASETGHVVFATLHTSTVQDTVDRILSTLEDDGSGVRSMLASTLQFVMCQTLCPTPNGRGRVAASEIMYVTDGVRANIRSGETEQIPNSFAMNPHNRSMEKHLAALCKEGRITPEVAEDKAMNKKTLAKYLGQMSYVPGGNGFSIPDL